MSEKPINQVRCIIYDCDGVMFDSLDANKRLYDTIAAGGGRGPLNPEELHYCHTHTVFESITHLFRANEEMKKNAFDYWKSSIDFKDFIVYLKMEPHLIETLGILKERGIKRAICTNRTTSMPHVMERFSLWPYFDLVVTALDVKNPKPHGEAVEKILDVLNVIREDTLFIGDSEVDRETARSGGVRFISYKNDRIGTHGSINDHLDLLGFLSIDRLRRS